MSWQTELPAIIRYMIGDFGETQTYSNAQLQSLSVTAAQLILTEIDFSNDYVVDVAATGISPDPTSGTRDNPFINLTSAKASCLLANAEFRIAGGKGLRVQDGNKSIDFGGVSKSKGEVAKSACQLYEDLKFEYKAGSRTGGKAVVGSISVYESLYRAGPPNFGYNRWHNS